jgi:hypothetical protein
VAFTLVGSDPSTLVLAYPFCSPMAIIVRDDDGFSECRSIVGGATGPG